MSRRSLLAWILGVVIAGAALSWPLPEAEGTPTTSLLTVQALIEGDQYVIVATGVAPAAGAWLGRSAYPYGIRDKCTQGVHEVVHVQGPFSQRFTLPINKVRGGSYEVALWSNRVAAAQCKIASDPWCKRNGFHLDGLLVYRGGWFPRSTTSRY